MLGAAAGSGQRHDPCPHDAVVVSLRHFRAVFVRPCPFARRQAALLGLHQGGLRQEQGSHLNSLQRLELEEQRKLLAAVPAELAGQFLCALAPPAALDALLALGPEATAGIAGAVPAEAGTKLLRAAGEDDAMTLLQVRLPRLPPA